MNTVGTETKSESYTFTWKVFEVGDWVSPTSPRCVLEPGIYEVTRFVDPLVPFEQDGTVFVKGKKHGVSSAYLELVNPDPFEVSTVREEKAYRLGYVEAWSVAQSSALAMGKRVACSPVTYSPGEIYRRMRVYQADILWHWLREESPEIDEPAPEFNVRGVQ